MVAFKCLLLACLVAGISSNEIFTKRLIEVYDGSVNSVNYEYGQIENLYAVSDDSNELAPEDHKGVLSLKVSLGDIASQYLNNTLELAKEQVGKAVDKLREVIVYELQGRIQNYTNAVIDCSHTVGVEKIPGETAARLQICLTEASNMSKPIVQEFTDELKRVPIVYNKFTDKLADCFVAMRNESKWDRIKDAYKCVVRVSSEAGSEMSTLASDIGNKGVQTAKKLANLVPHVKDCYEKQLELVLHDLQQVNKDLAKCTEESIGKKVQ